MVRPGLCVSGVRLEPALPYPGRRMMDVDVFCAQVERRDWLYSRHGKRKRRKGTHRVLVVEARSVHALKLDVIAMTTSDFRFRLLICVLREMGFHLVVLGKDLESAWAAGVRALQGSFVELRDRTILAVNIPSLRLKWRTVDRNVVTLSKLGFG
ncbi:hypothetical protein EV421DRAFT_1860506 [Armillaria borealis]|uniref:Uncharacterized protein n=1 Tax=Armillaria borealis TaxID=47425 RepID=A0AA39ITA4_9AGAR|nr:hypothetical protein EV421DRAFT_1860506 [Armillaria borealis]